MAHEFRVPEKTYQPPKTIEPTSFVERLRGFLNRDERDPGSTVPYILRGVRSWAPVVMPSGVAGLVYIAGEQELYVTAAAAILVGGMYKAIRDGRY